MDTQETKPTPIHIQLDLETLGTKPGCKILSIGAVVFKTDGTFTFDYQPSPDKWYYARVHPGSLSQGTLHESSETIDWWNKQSQEAREEAFGGIDYLFDILREFKYWIECFKAPVIIWCKGATFDVPILEAAFKEFDIEIPWAFRNVRCQRTLESLMPQIAAEIKFEGIKHNALHDAIHQARVAEKIFAVLGYIDLSEYV